MAFGQQSGPPATARQVRDLLSLLQDAGHLDFRDARGPMGFTQRQAGGKFTRDEADDFIGQLQQAADERASGDAAPDGDAAADGGTEPALVRPIVARTRTEELLRTVPTERLAAEIQRRGWVVIEP